MYNKLAEDIVKHIEEIKKIKDEGGELKAVDFVASMINKKEDITYNADQIRLSKLLNLVSEETKPEKLVAIDMTNNNRI